MAAGLGFKTFNTGDVLTAADTNGYLMQGVLVFADAAARSAAITSPQEGQTSYLKSDDTVYTYSGSAWNAVGLPSQTGNASKYLTTDGTTPSWGAVSADKTLAQIASGSTTSGTSLSLTSLTSYDTLKFKISGVTTSANNALTMRINSSSSAVYDYLTWFPSSNNTTTFDGGYFQNREYDASNTSIPMTLSGYDKQYNSPYNIFEIDFYNCKATGFTTFEYQGWFVLSNGAGYLQLPVGRGIFKSAAAVSSIQFNTTSAFTAGSYVLWGG